MENQKFTQKEGTFSLFKSKEKKQENSPDFTGKALFNGTELRLSGWGSKSKNGEVYVSGYIEEYKKNAPQSEIDGFISAAEPSVQPVPPAANPEKKDDLPF